MNLTPIEQMSREEAITNLCGMAKLLTDSAFCELFPQSSRSRPASLIGMEVASVEKGVAFLAHFGALAKQIQLLPAAQQP